MKDKLTNIWLWIVAIATCVAIICTFISWVAGIAILITRWING